MDEDSGDYKEVEDGGSPVLLFRSPRGSAGSDEPSEGEVAWHPYFDPSNCESKKKPEWVPMHKKLLADCHEYLREKDPEQVKQMDVDLDQPSWPKWNTLFKLMKKLKKEQMRRRQSTRKRRTAVARQGGVLDQDIDINSDTSEDSAYESQEEAVRKPLWSAASPRSANAVGKRKVSHQRTNGVKHNPKKAKPSASDSLMRRAAGANGADRSPSVLGRPGPDHSDREANDESDEMDTRDPNRAMPPPPRQRGVSSWNFNGLSATQHRVTGRSVSGSAHGSPSLGALNVTEKENGSNDEADHGTQGNLYLPPQSKIDVQPAWADAMSYNGTGEAEAYQRAISESVAPEARSSSPTDGNEQEHDDFKGEDEA